MKSIFFLITILISTYTIGQELSQCDNYESLLKIKVEKIVEKGIEISPYDPQHYLELRHCEKYTEFINVWPQHNSESIGLVLDYEELEEPNYMKINFTWIYFNTYDDRSGQAKVQIDLHRMETYIYVYTTIIGSKNDFLMSYKGYAVPK